jgi:hypothetical protein
MLEHLLQRAAEPRERLPCVVERLQDDGRARVELGEHAADISRPGEGIRSPRQVGRVVADVQLCALFDEPEGRVPNAAGADEPLDGGEREQVVETPRLVPRYDERPLLPVVAEEVFGREGL